MVNLGVFSLPVISRRLNTLNKGVKTAFSGVLSNCPYVGAFACGETLRAPARPEKRNPLEISTPFILRLT